MKCLFRVLTIAISTMGLVSSGEAPFESKSNLRTILARAGSLSNEDLTTLEKGEIVVKELKTKDKKEISVIGLVRLSLTARPTLNEFRESLNQKDSKSIIQGGSFSTPPSKLDLKNLRLEKSDLEDLSKCKAGSCKLLVSDSFIQKLALSLEIAVDSAALETLYIEDLVGFAQDFELHGLDALRRFDGSKRSPPLAEQNKELFDKVPFLGTLARDMAIYLKNFPTAQLSETEAGLNWTKVKFGLKPIVTITKTTSNTPYDEQAPLTIVMQQIYASRYMNGSVTVAMLIRENAAGPLYLIFSNTSRSDALGGLFSGFKRSVAKSEGLDRTRELLEIAKTRFESTPERDASKPPESETEAPSSRLWGDWTGLIGLISGVGIILLILMGYRSRWRRTNTYRSTF